MQKTVVAHDTENNPPSPTSTGLGAAHVGLRLWMTAFPPPSTARQNFTVGHDTEASSPPESTRVGEAHTPEAKAGLSTPAKATAVPITTAAARTIRVPRRRRGMWDRDV